MISKYKFRIKLHSFHIASLLAVGTLVGSVAIGLFIQQNPIINKFDALLYDKISNGFHHPFLDLLVWPININFLPLGFVPSYFYPWITGMLLYLLIFRRKLLPWALLCFILGTVIAYIITYIDWKLVYRERPFVTLPSQVDETWRAIWSNFSSFPSGHARETTLYATFTAAYFR
jgi:membrane-associated phospholipid phosphatase